MKKITVVILLAIASLAGIISSIYILSLELDVMFKIGIVSFFLILTIIFSLSLRAELKDDRREIVRWDDKDAFMFLQSELDMIDECEVILDEERDLQHMPKQESNVLWDRAND